MSRLRLCLLLILGAVAMRMAAAQPTPHSPSPVRYHYGDNPAWASPAFDDSSWPVAPDGRVPPPPFNSDGFLWVRTRVPIPAGIQGPLAIQSVHAYLGPGVQEIFVNGIVAGQAGQFPPHASPRLIPRNLTFSLSPEVAPDDRAALVALRGWSPPYIVLAARPGQFTFAIDRATVLQTAARADSATALLAALPAIIPNLLLMLLGLALLGFLRRLRSRDLLLNAIWLIALPMYVVPSILGEYGFTPLPFRLWAVLFFLIRIPGFWVIVEFIWTVHRLPDRRFRALAHVCWIVYLLSDFISTQAMHPATWIRTWEPSLLLFNAICLGANLWALFVTRRNRIVAAAFTLINIPYILAVFGVPPYLHFGPTAVSYQVVGFAIAGVTITATLIRHALDSWETSQQLRAEFQAAREVQQRLVPATLPTVPGCRIESAYLPAAEVGGDFFQVIPRPDGTTLIAIGDVSGKGLKAAMTGALAIGALRTLAAEALTLAATVARLNRQIVEAQDGGFITCLAALLRSDGTLTLANAGHLAPYRNGSELSIENGLPLGIAPDAAYPESTFRLAPNDRLTLLSDGVLEAQSPTGELFGFDRTRDISTQSAEAIAQAAQAYGQEDDITVLTITFAPAEVLHA